MVGGDERAAAYSSGDDLDRQASARRGVPGGRRGVVRGDGRLEPRFADSVTAGRLRLHVGDVGRLPPADGAVDHVLTVNTVYFWSDLGAAFGEVRRVLAPGGPLVVAR
jgi:SAM-dependent methyltransferase